jgi:DNA-binding transcriptional ArsR family regulator
MGELRTKVSKEFTAKYDILSDVIVSPVRIEILNKLSDHPDGLSYEDLVKLLRPELRQSNVQKHLDRLVEEDVAVEDKDEKYSLSKLGEETYDTLAKVALRAKSEQIFSNP